MKKKYFEPEIEINAFHISDIITVSEPDSSDESTEGGMTSGSEADLTGGGSAGIEMDMNDAQ